MELFPLYEFISSSEISKRGFESTIYTERFEPSGSSSLIFSPQRSPVTSLKLSQQRDLLVLKALSLVGDLNPQQSHLCPWVAGHQLLPLWHLHLSNNACQPAQQPPQALPDFQITMLVNGYVSFALVTFAPSHLTLLLPPKRTFAPTNLYHLPPNFFSQNRSMYKFKK